MQLFVFVYKDVFKYFYLVLSEPVGLIIYECVFETIQMNVSLCNQGEHRCVHFCVNILGLCYSMCGFVAACVCFTDV